MLSSCKPSHSDMRSGLTDSIHRTDDFTSVYTVYVCVYVPLADTEHAAAGFRPRSTVVNTHAELFDGSRCCKITFQRLKSFESIFIHRFWFYFLYQFCFGNWCNVVRIFLIRGKRGKWIMSVLFFLCIPTVSILCIPTEKFKKLNLKNWKCPLYYILLTHSYFNYWHFYVGLFVCFVRSYLVKSFKKLNKIK